MSQPTTRSKYKRVRHRQGDNVDITSEIMRKIHATGEITTNDVNQLLMILKPVCQGCRVNTKGNPNCFCGLIPPPNGSRKSGLWQKLSDIVQALGPDPCKVLCDSADSPAGLTNLGATCYANSMLQCLYMNKSLREGVFSVEPVVLKQHPVLHQLARLFAQLHTSKMDFVDSAPFIKTLELDNGVQQDSHEFLTLLLSLLERCLSHSKVSKARTIVQDLFRGSVSVSHVTTCSKCGRDSEASSKMDDFYELELNVKGLKSLDESLDDYLSVEELHGENQYFCLHPFGECSSSSSKVAHSEPPGGTDGKHALSNGNHMDTVHPESLKSNIGSHIETFSSNDAYMLMYNLRRTAKVDERRPVDFGASKIEIEGCEACEQYKLKKDRELNHISERRQEVQSILSEAPVQSFEEPSYWVSSDWLRQWADNYGGGPTLTNDDYCMSCLFDGAQSVVCADSYRDRRTLMRDLASDVIAGKCLEGTYYVSKTWLQQWVRRKTFGAPNEADAGATVSIRCPHGQLMPEQAPGTKRLLVPEKLWLFLYEDVIAVKPDDPLGCTTFPSDSEQCPQCCDELSEVACLEDSLRAVKLKQRQNHEKLAMGKYGLTIITENDWTNFCEEWGGNKEKGMSALIEPGNVAENNLAGSCKETTSEKHLNPQDENCEDCIGERESCKLMQKLNYSNEDIYVCLINGKEAPKSILEASETASGPDRRASKRSRKTGYGNSVVKVNQILHKGSRIIDQECATLADLNIFPGHKLLVQDSEIHEHRDIADELADQKMTAQHAEEGFRGTRLTAYLSPQVV
ncbi:hypothetical protein GH714_023405 [Hevea brasiliensis]|uniref:ubiquitinyl hydrolase 1 n=1 Tax=Hevea brasiliensis TaxID=3981 RepID=A0A6A6KTU5_HEVBR|nr:hypothetical protein GH714_023405 [Hevea brasiliensis]